jgi:hypothetical protein
MIFGLIASSPPLHSGKAGDSLIIPVDATNK